MSAEVVAARGTVQESVLRSLASANRTGQDLAGYHAATRADEQEMFTRTEIKPLTELDQWLWRPGDERVRHHTGGFFTVEGVHVRLGEDPARTWDQPIVVQPEVGVLGILAKEFDGVLHFLMQNKVEPGNRNGIQLSPTVQATRSNFKRVHRGKGIPYLEYFRDPRVRHRVLVDVRHSEQGSWFFRKRNRNVVLEVFDDVPLRDGWYWLTLGQVAELMRHDDLVNMETRSVLSCLPFPDVSASPPRHRTVELLAWITQERSDDVSEVRPCSLSGVEGWEIGGDRFSHRTGRYFSVVGVDVVAGGREVRRWDQPMISAGDGGVVGLLVSDIGGNPHVLLQLRAEAGGFDGPELAPTVQCDPGNYDPQDRPPFLEQVLGADPEDVLFDTMLSDEGGRFYRTSHRHLVVRAPGDSEPPGFRWVSLAQCAELARHSHYLNVQTRSLLACVHPLYAEVAG